MDLTESGYLAAKANARMEPIECATKWKEFNLKEKMIDSSIISKWSSSVYKHSLGLGLFPNPNKSTPNNLYLFFVWSEKWLNIVSVQNDEEDMNPCKNITFSMTFFSSAYQKQHTH